MLRVAYCALRVRVAWWMLCVVLSVPLLVCVLVGYFVCSFACSNVRAIGSTAALLYESPEQKPG